MTVTRAPWYAGRYLELAFEIDVAAGFDPGPLAGFLDAHCEPLAPGAVVDRRFHLAPAAACAGIAGPWITDLAGSRRCDVPPDRWYASDGAVASFGGVQDVYCGLRRIAARQLARAVLLHAAAVRVAGRTALILGDKGSGKSFAGHACLLAGADHLASDKTCVWATARGLRCAGLIGSVRLSLADAERFAGSAAHRAVCARLREVSRDPARVVTGKISLDPSELCRLLGVRPIAAARPSALVFLDRPGDPVALAAIDRGEAERRLAALALADHGPGDPGIALPGASDRVLAELAGSAACLRLSGRPPAAWFGTELAAELAG
jgi:hypothetical protein